MSEADYHAQRAMQELAAGLAAAAQRASEAHFRLYSLHIKARDRLAGANEAPRMAARTREIA